MSKLIDELKRRYGTPEAVFRRLGLDSSVMEEEMTQDRPRPLRRLGRDDQEEPMRTADELVDAIRAALLDLAPEEQEQVVEALGELVDSGNPEQWAGDRTRGRRVGRDEPEPFSGRPRPGGEMDPIREARDRRRRQAQDRAALAFDRAHPQDLAGARDFARRFPNAARIRNTI